MFFRKCIHSSLPSKFCLFLSITHSLIAKSIKRETFGGGKKGQTSKIGKEKNSQFYTNQLVSTIVQICVQCWHNKKLIVLLFSKVTSPTAPLIVSTLDANINAYNLILHIIF